MGSPNREKKLKLSRRLKRWFGVNPLRLRRAMDEAIAGAGGNMPRVIPKISSADRMLRDDPVHYFSVGYSALRNIRAALDAAGRRDVREILDLPCGHGRVLRMLKAEFPAAHITACDLETDGVDFSAKAFGATPVYSKVDPAEIPLNGPFDLIWVGSLFTHLDSPWWPAFLRFFQRVLAPGGVLVFTTHGAHAAQRMKTRERKYSLTDDQLDAVLADCERSGFGYSDYQGGAGYGISLTTAERVKAFVAATPGLSLLSYTERAWDDHQDVVACVRR